MSRLLVIFSVLSVLALGFFFALAGAGPQTRYFAETSLGLFVIIVFVVLVSSALTMALVWLFNNRLAWGDRIARRRIHLYVGWKLLRSHREVPTRGTRLRMALHQLRARSTARKLGLVVAGTAALGLLWMTDGPGFNNAISDAVSPEFTWMLQTVLAALGGLFVTAGLIGLAAGRPLGEPEPVTRPRSAVSLPTFISIVGVAIGIWALIVVLGVMHGLQSDLRNKILRTSAHVVIEPEEPQGALGDGLTLEGVVAALPGVVEAHAFVHGEVMVSSPSGIAVNVVVKGMNEDALETSRQLAGKITSGGVEWIRRPEGLIPDRFRYPMGLRADELQPPADDAGADSIDGFGLPPSARTLPEAKLHPGILIGIELARNLNVDVGSEIQLISPDGDVGPTGLRPKLAPFRVAGIFKTGMYEYDQKLAYTAIDDAQRFFNYGSDLNRLEARLQHAEDAETTMAAVGQLLSKDYPGLNASDWQQRNKSLFSALQLERIVMFIILGFIIFVASLLIVSSLVMLVVEKVKEIAVLKALGASDRSVVKTFLVIGSFIGVFGALAGVPLGVVTCLIIITQGFTLPREFYIDTLPVNLDAFEVAIVGLAALGMCLLATLYPSYQASKLRPADGLRHG